MKRWHVVHTQARREQEALLQLINQGYNVFLSYCQQIRRHARKVDVVRAPLFPRYLFIELDYTVDRWYAINSTRGVSYILCQDGLPLSVEEGVVELLKTQMTEEACVPLSALELFKAGAKVEILEGPFVGQVGVYEKMTPDSRVRVLLNFLGKKVAVDIPPYAVAEAV